MPKVSVPRPVTCRADRTIYLAATLVLLLAASATLLIAGSRPGLSASGPVWTQVHKVPGVSAVNVTLLDPSGKLYVVVNATSLVHSVGTIRDVMTIVQRMLVDSPYLEVAVRVDVSVLDADGREKRAPVAGLTFLRKDIASTDFFVLPDAAILSLGKPQPIR